MERRSEAVGSSGHSVSAVYRLVVSSLAFHSFRPQAWARGVSERRETTRRAAEWTTLARGSLSYLFLVSPSEGRPGGRSDTRERTRREWTEDRRYGPLTLLSSRTSPASSGRLSLRLRLSVVPPSRCAGDDEKRGKEWTKMLNSLVIYLYLLFSSFYIYWYSFCYLHVLIIISSHIFYCSFLIFSMSFITSSSNKYRILIFFQLHFIFLIFAIIFYLHITSFIIWIPYLVNIIMIYFLVYKILLLSSLQLLTINFLCFSIL